MITREECIKVLNFSQIGRIMQKEKPENLKNKNVVPRTIPKRHQITIDQICDFLKEKIEVMIKYD